MDELSTALTQLLIAVATAGIAYAVKKFRDLVNAGTNEKNREALEHALINSIKWANGKFAGGVAPTRAETVSGAVTYIYANLPGIVKALGLDHESVIKLIEARLDPAPTKSGF